MLEVIALSPPCFPNPIVAQAAHRAGFSGGVALEYISLERAESILGALTAAGTEFTVSAGQLLPVCYPCLSRPPHMVCGA